MALLLCAMIFGGPLAVALASALLVVPAGVIPAETGCRIAVVVLSLGVVTTLGAVGTSALYRWWFAQATSRGAGLLTALMLSIFFLSHEPTVSFIAHIASAEPMRMPPAGVFLTFCTEAAVLFGIAIAACTLIVLVIELPMRWIQAHEVIISQGDFRMLRLIGIVVVVVVSSALLREEGVVRLESTIRRVLS